jgi:hypothetical protein
MLRVVWGCEVWYHVCGIIFSLGEPPAFGQSMRWSNTQQMEYFIHNDRCALFLLLCFRHMMHVFVHAVSPWLDRNSGELQISEHIQLYGLCSGICSLLEFTIDFGCTACTKSYHFALVIARALSFQNVTFLRVTSYLGLGHVHSIDITIEGMVRV